jgi:hypothetical protein
MKNVIPKITEKGVIITAAVIVALLFGNALFFALAEAASRLLTPTG